MTITGPDWDQFSVEQQPIAAVQPNEMTTFIIQFMPTSIGPKTAYISIADNDSNENPYDITLLGTGLDIGPLKIKSGFRMRLTSPEGDIRVRAGSHQTITWEGGEEVPYVRVEYSTDNGSTCRTIAARVPNDGRLDWLVPPNLSSSCLIRISDAEGIPVQTPEAVTFDFSFKVTTPAVSERAFAIADREAEAGPVRRKDSGTLRRRGDMARASGEAASPLNPGIKVAGPSGTGGGEIGVLSISPAGTYYIYGFDGRLLAEYNGLGICVRDYIYMGGKLIAEYRPQENAYFYYTSDQINSTRIVTDDTGAVVYAAAHDPYGGIQQTWTSAYDPALKFSGKERDTESGLDYFGARYYDHSLYRFLSVDPVISQQHTMQNPQRWNLYSYCGNKPINYVDPDGRTYIIFSKQTQLLYIYTSDNVLWGVFNASCNPSGNLPFPNETWEFTWWNLEGHVNADSWDGIDNLGAIHFNFRDTPQYNNYCLHSGRDMSFDGAGRWYWQYATNGCIRTERLAMMALYTLHFIIGDAITEIRVYDFWDPTMTAEDLQRLQAQAERDYWSMESYYNMINDYFFMYGPIPPWAQ